MRKSKSLKRQGRKKKKPRKTSQYRKKKKKKFCTSESHSKVPCSWTLTKLKLIKKKLKKKKKLQS